MDVCCLWQLERRNTSLFLEGEDTENYFLPEMKMVWIRTVYHPFNSPSLLSGVFPS